MTKLIRLCAHQSLTVSSNEMRLKYLIFFWKWKASITSFCIRQIKDVSNNIDSVYCHFASLFPLFVPLLLTKLRWDLRLIYGFQYSIVYRLHFKNRFNNRLFLTSSRIESVQFEYIYLSVVNTVLMYIDIWVDEIVHP